MSYLTPLVPVCMIIANFSVAKKTGSSGLGQRRSEVGMYKCSGCTASTTSTIAVRRPCVRTPRQHHAHVVRGVRTISSEGLGGLYVA